MKTLLRPGLLALVGLLTVPVALGASRSASQEAKGELPSARALIDRFAEVTHAKEVVEKTRSMHVLGKFSMAGMGLEGPAEIWSARPNLRTVSIQMGAFGQTVTGYDGKHAWMVQPMMGARLLSGTELLQASLEADYDAALKRGDKFLSMETVAKETFEGKECFKVKLVAKPSPGMDAAGSLQARTSFEYYEVASGLLAGTSGYIDSEMGSGPFTTVSSDYKDFGGQLLATRTRVRQSGIEIELSFTSVEYDTATAETFAPPAEVRALLEDEEPAAAGKGG